MTYRLSQKAHIFETSMDALLATVSYAARIAEIGAAAANYQTEAVCRNPDRAIVGFRVKVLDMEGYSLGFVAPSQEPQIIETLTPLDDGVTKIELLKNVGDDGYPFTVRVTTPLVGKPGEVNVYNHGHWNVFAAATFAEGRADAFREAGRATQPTEAA